MDNLKSALILGITDLNALARNIQRVSHWTMPQRQNILENAQKIIPNEAENGEELAMDLCYHKSFCREAKIDYSNPDFELIKTGIADYLLQ